MTFGGIIEKYYSFVFELRTNKKSTIAAELERMSEECEGINQGDDQIPDKITSIIRISLAHADPISDLQFNRIVENKDRSVKITPLLPDVLQDVEIVSSQISFLHISAYLLSICLSPLYLSPPPYLSFSSLFIPSIPPLLYLSLLPIYPLLPICLSPSSSIYPLLFSISPPYQILLTKYILKGRRIYKNSKSIRY